MKVALVIDHFDAGRGGAETYTRNLTRILVEEGHEVHIFANTFKEVPSGARIHQVPIVKFPRGLKVVSLALALEGRLRKEEFDVVQGFGATWAVDVHRPGGGSERAWFRAELESLGTNWSKVWRGLLLLASAKFLANLWLEGKIYRGGDLPLVIANSDMAARQIRSHYPSVNSRKLKVVMNPVDSVRFHPQNMERFRVKMRDELGISNEKILMLFAAHNFRLKGLGCLLEALERGIPPNYVLVVAGRGKPRRYASQLRKIAIPVIFVGALEGLERLMAASDILIHPTFYDPCANVVLEAMASGIPVITTMENGASQLVEHGSSGYILSTPRDTEKMREYILALEDPSERKKMGEAARKKVEPLTWEDHSRRLEEIYRESMELKGRRDTSFEMGKKGSLRETS